MYKYDSKSNVAESEYEINIRKQRYPYCIVWTPLPLISWFLPMIGHTGICMYIY